MRLVGLDRQQIECIAQVCALLYSASLRNQTHTHTLTGCQKHAQTEDNPESIHFRFDADVGGNSVLGGSKKFEGTQQSSYESKLIHHRKVHGSPKASGAFAFCLVECLRRIIIEIDEPG